MDTTILSNQIDSILDTVVGQEQVKRRVKQWALAAGCEHGDGYMKPLLFSGEPGRGKSRFLKIIADIIRLATPAKTGNILSFKKGCDVGAPSAFVKDVVRKHVDQKDGAMIIDEVHEANPGTLGFIRSMIQPDIERGPVILDHADGEITVDPRKYTFVLATNKTDSICPTLLSRVLDIQLQAPSDEDVAEILRRGVEANGITFHEDSLTPLAKTCRGTARDVADIVNDLIGYLQVLGKNTVNQKDIREVLKIRGILPEGVTEMELNTLLYLEREPLQLQEIACRNGLLPKEQRVLDTYLFRKGFLTVNAKREITGKGRTYLEYLRLHKLTPYLKNPALV